MRFATLSVCSAFALMACSTASYAQEDVRPGDARPGQVEGQGRGPGGRGPGGEGGRGFGGRGGEGGRGGGFGNFARMLPIMKALDTNEDGELSADEINNAVTALKKLDKNSDGKLDQEELRPEMPEGFGGRGPGGEGGRGPGGEGGRGPGGAGGGQGGGMAERMFAYDANKDGKLEKSELPERIQGMFDRLDADKDGVLTKEEVSNFRPTRPESN